MQLEVHEKSGSGKAAVMRDSCNIQCHRVSAPSEVLVSRGILEREEKASGSNNENLAKKGPLWGEGVLQGRDNWNRGCLCPDRCPVVPPGVASPREPKHSGRKIVEG